MTGGKPADGPPRLVVMQSYRALRSTTNPYLAQLAAAIGVDVDVVPFAWRRALTGSFDVLHAHWPETLLAGRPGIRAVARRVLMLALLVRLSVTRVAVVRTLHNLSSHESPSAAERWLLAGFDARTTLWIRLNVHTPPPRPGPVVTIRHGHYRDWFDDLDRPTAVPGRFLTFGLVRPYKGVENLLARFHELDDPALTLRVVGKPSTPALRAEVESLADADPRVSTILDHVDDGRLATEVGEAELVILPYREMHNSGALLLALSLDRPVLVPRGVVTVDLGAEVGKGWVTTFDGDLSAADIVGSLQRIRERNRANGVQDAGDRPDLGEREWAAIGSEHVSAYRSAVDIRRSHAEAGATGPTVSTRATSPDTPTTTISPRDATARPGRTP